MKQINWGNVALFVVFATFLVFPLAGGAETILIFRSDASIQLKLIIAGVWVAMTIPLSVIDVKTPLTITKESEGSTAPGRRSYTALPRMWMPIFILPA